MAKKKREEEKYEMGEAIGKAKAEVGREMAGQIVPVPKELAPYSDGQPFSKERAYTEMESLFHHEALHAQGLVRARIEVGKRLVLLHEMSGVPVLYGGDRRSKTFKTGAAVLKNELEERFPWLTRQRRAEYIRVARAAVEYPNKFKEFLEGTGGMQKGLALIRNLEEEELKALDAGEEVEGATLDEYVDMSREDLVAALRKARKKEERGKEQYEKQSREVERLQKGYQPTEEQYEGMMKGFTMRFDQLMDRVDPEVMTQLRKDNNPTNKMKAQYLAVLDYMKKRVLASYDMAVDTFGTAEMFPENVWHPGKEMGGLTEIPEEWDPHGLAKPEKKKK